MFLEKKGDSKTQNVGYGGEGSVYMLMRNYIEHECKLSQTFTRERDLNREVQSRLAKIFCD